MPERVFVTQRTADGTRCFGHHLVWDPAKEQCDPIKEARGLRELNAKLDPLRSVNFPAFFVSRVQYAEPERSGEGNQQQGDQDGELAVGEILGSTLQRLDGV